MSTTVFYPTNKMIISIGSTYANARAGTYVLDIMDYYSDMGYVHLAGQQKDVNYYYLSQSYLRFDTSAIGSDIVTAATLSLYPYDLPGSPGDLEAYQSDFGASIGTEDWIPGASVSGLTKLASIASGSFTTGARDLTSTADFKDLINGSGNTDITLLTSKFRIGTAPSGIDFFVFYSVERGGSYRPKLTVEHSAAPSGLSIPVAMHHYNTLRR